MPLTRERITASWTDLPSAARRVLLVDLLSTAGSGIVMPFLAIYAGRVRDLGPTVGAIVVTALATGCLPANLIAGAAADRYGARRVLVAGWTVAAIGDLFLLRSAHVQTVLAAAVLIGFGVGTSYPATSTLLAEVTPPPQRSLVFATQYGLSNVGFSIGIGISALIVTEPGLHRFQALYTVDAVTFLLAGLILIRATLPVGDSLQDADPGPGGSAPIAGAGLETGSVEEAGAALVTDAVLATDGVLATDAVLETGSVVGTGADPGTGSDSETGPGLGAAVGSADLAGGYRAVFRDSAFRWLCLVQVFLVIFGYAQFEAALPLYLSRPHGLQPSAIALVFVANTIFVALAALPAGRLGPRFSPVRLITAGAVCFATCWLLLWRSQGSGWPSVGIAISAVLVMGVGEVLLAPAVGPLVNQLSPPELRGRYNALSALILSVGTIIGPGVVAILYTGASAGPLFVVLTGGCLVAALLTSRRLTPARVGRGPILQPLE
jgi:MFS family permease